MSSPRWAILWICATAMACESSPQAKPVAARAPAPSPASVTQLDQAELVAVAQRLRDREFAAKPVLVAGEPAAMKPSGCTAACDRDRARLQKILLAGELPVEPKPLAKYDAGSHTVTYDASHADADSVRAAAIAELVLALDESAPIEVQTWDAYLASRALRRGGGVFVAALDRANRLADHVDAERLAGRPDALLQLGIGGARFADGFATREGFAFTAAMIRSGGWSTYELAHAEPPGRSLEVVRPDRYLAGDQPGQWTFPEELVATRAQAGLNVEAEGRVGPAITAEWFARRIPAAAARGVYVAYESDAYVAYQGADDAWAFDWVSMWADPSAAEQVAEAVEANLSARADGARFVVLRTGNVVGVVGQSAAVKLDVAPLSTAIAGAKVTFQQPTPRGVPFVATVLDKLTSREPMTSVPRASWTDTATGTTVDLGALDPRWQLIATSEPNLPWFAKHESGAVLQYLVEPPALLDPPPSDDAFAAKIGERFAQTIESGDTLSVRRGDAPLPRTTVVDARGPIRDRRAEGPVHLRAWLFEAGGAITTLSLQAPPGEFEALVQGLDPVLNSLRVPTSRASSDDGIVTFEVED